MVNCFTCAFCKRNGDKHPHINKNAAYCDCPSFLDNKEYTKYCRVSTHTSCMYWTNYITGKKKENDMRVCECKNANTFLCKRCIHRDLRLGEVSPMPSGREIDQLEVYRLKELLCTIRECAVTDFNTTIERLANKGLEKGFRIPEYRFKEVLENL